MHTVCINIPVITKPIGWRQLFTGNDLTEIFSLENQLRFLCLISIKCAFHTFFFLSNEYRMRFFLLLETIRIKKPSWVIQSLFDNYTKRFYFKSRFYTLNRKILLSIAQVITWNLDWFCFIYQDFFHRKHGNE